MRQILMIGIGGWLLAGATAFAEEGHTVTVGRLFTNDFLGDGQDRWHTGSYVVSAITATRPWPELPPKPGELLEWRFRAEIIAPANTGRPGPTDRRYVGNLSVGVHTHYARQNWQTSFGFDLVAIGPSTGLSDFQQAVHSIIGNHIDAAANNQLTDSVHPTVLVETGRLFSLTEKSYVRPFFEAQAGVETFLRTGIDIAIGDGCAGGLRIRDVTTGHRYRTSTCTDDRGATLMIGADVAKVFDSAYLPSADGYDTTDIRGRVRFGMEWSGEHGSVFYGLTYLGREFEGQPEGQLVGALNVKLAF